MAILRGRVTTGLGDCGIWIQRLADHYQRKTGLQLFPGTLNIQCEEPWSLPPDCIRLEAHEYGGTVSVSMVPCRILGRRAFILRTDANEAGIGDHPRTIIEVATDIGLREAFGLRDDDAVEIEVLHGAERPT